MKRCHFIAFKTAHGYGNHVAVNMSPIDWIIKENDRVGVDPSEWKVLIWTMPITENEAQRYIKCTNDLSKRVEAARCLATPNVDPKAN